MIPASSSARAIDVVVAGYLGVDLTPGFNAARTPTSPAELFRPVKLIEVEGLNISLGGVVANTGLALRRFGQRVELMSCVGNDALGDLAIAQLARAGVTRGIRRTDKAGTAYGFVIAPPGMDRFFLEDPGCNRCFTADDIDYDVVRQSRLFHFGYPPLMPAVLANTGAELQKIFRRVRELGVTTSLDMALPDAGSPAGTTDWPAILAGTLPLVDIFVPSIEELLFMLDRQEYNRCLSDDMIAVIPPATYARLADRVLSLGVKTLLIKAGHRGAYLRAGNSPAIWLKPYPVDAKRFFNACGAGDCAVAGFLSALLNGADVTTAGRFAMLAGRDNLYGPDAVSGLREWSEMKL